MARLRHGQEMQTISPIRRPLRIVASGTLFLTHTLSLPFHPIPSSVTRAHSVEKTRGGSASTLLSLLAQFPVVDAMLVASLGGNDDGKMILRDLEREGVNTRFCKVWANYGVPSAWVLQTGECCAWSFLLFNYFDVHLGAYHDGWVTSTSRQMVMHSGVS
jgi:hypothetical protein